MKDMFPTIYLIDTGDGNPCVSIYLNVERENFSTCIPAERFKRLILHPRNKLGLYWADVLNYMDTGFGLVGVCSQDVADRLQQYPDEVERIFKRCFGNIAPELAGLEIEDAKIKVYHGQTKDAE